MKNLTYKDWNRNWRHLVTFILGTWLLIAPFVLPQVANDDAIYNNSLAIGLLLQAAAVGLFFRHSAWMEWSLVVLSSWAIAASYFYNNGVLFDGFNFSLATNLFTIGIIVMILAGLGLFRSKAIRDMDRPSAA